MFLRYDFYAGVFEDVPDGFQPVNLSRPKMREGRDNCRPARVRVRRVGGPFQPVGADPRDYAFAGVASKVRPDRPLFLWIDSGGSTPVSSFCVIGSALLFAALVVAVAVLVGENLGLITSVPIANLPGGKTGGGRQNGPFLVKLLTRGGLTEKQAFCRPEAFCRPPLLLKTTLPIARAAVWPVQPRAFFVAFPMPA